MSSLAMPVANQPQAAPPIASSVRAQPLVDMADPAPYAGARRIVRAVSGAGAVAVAWDDGEIAEFHPLWLRSECACPEVSEPRHAGAHVQSFPPAAGADADGGRGDRPRALRVVWPPDGHVSLFDPGWLWSKSRPHSAPTAQVPWQAELAKELPVFEHAAIMTDDRALHGWLVALRDVGLALLRGVPCEPGEVDRIARRISLPRDTNFGVVFDVITKADANSNAYTSIELPGHVDLPTREYQPGFQFFHCLENRAAGGESTYVDGFALAEHLRLEHPDSYRLLCATPIGFRFYDQVSDYVWQTPVIGLGPDGAPREIRFNPWLTEPLEAAPERFAGVYGALRRFDELARDPRFQIRIRLDAGTMSAFDNRRVLHGRAAFDERGGRRHFQGCYVEREEVINRIRVLERSF